MRCSSLYVVRDVVLSLLGLWIIKHSWPSERAAAPNPKLPPPTSVRRRRTFRPLLPACCDYDPPPSTAPSSPAQRRNPIQHLYYRPRPLPFPAPPPNPAAPLPPPPPPAFADPPPAPPKPFCGRRNQQTANASVCVCDAPHK